MFYSIFSGPLHHRELPHDRSFFSISQRPPHMEVDLRDPLLECFLGIHSTKHHIQMRKSHEHTHQLLHARLEPLIRGHALPSIEVVGLQARHVRHVDGGAVALHL